MSITITSKVADQVNYAALHLNLQELVGDIALSGIETDSLVCKITSVPEFIYEYKQIYNVTGSSMVLKAPELKINNKFCREELIEAREGELKIEIYHPDDEGTTLGFFNAAIHLQPYLHWDGSRYPETMPGFMQPNDPLVQQVIKRAGEYAAAENQIMCGYQCRSEEGVKKQAEYIYRALQDMSIHYISAPASFEECGQKLRIPHQVLHEESKQGTCLDLAVLYATCLEAVSLNAVIVLIPGHAFTGVWTVAHRFEHPLVRPDNKASEVWLQALKSIVPVECTTFTDDRNIDFESAVRVGTKNMSECRYLIDVAAARVEGLVPVYTYTDKPICDVADTKPKAPCDVPGMKQSKFARTEFSQEKKSKLEILRDQAMDISVKSKLLNNEAEALAIEFEIDTESFLTGGLSDEDLTVKVENIPNKKKKTNDTLRELYSKSRQNIRETGKSNLFLSVNELRWKQETSGKYFRAVMYLCPAEIYRNGRGDFQLRLNTDELFFNPALKVLLAHSYHLDSNILLDRPGNEYAAQMEQLKFLIGNQKGWSIKENIARLAQYKIPNEAVWNGLNEKSVISHEIVRGILEGKMDWDNEVPVDAAYHDPNKVYAFETDSSQCEIIQSAFEKKAQVIAGAAGNGKTQTIVNIMLEAVCRGQKVLFVSEKLPALEVAYDKLNQVFDGLFNLKIIQGKDKPADVVKQLRKTLDHIEICGVPEIDENIEAAKVKHSESMKYLENYYSLMSRKNPCGKSLEELIEMYEQYADCLLSLDVADVADKVTLSDAEEAISLLSKVIDNCDQSKGSYSTYIRYSSMEGNEEQNTVQKVTDALEKYRKVRVDMKKLRDLLEISQDSSEKKDSQNMLVLAKLFLKYPVYGKSIEEVLAEKGQGSSILKKELLRSAKAASKDKIQFTKTRKLAGFAQLLQQIYTDEEVQSTMEEFYEEPQKVIERLESLEIIETDQGFSLGASESEKEKLCYLLQNSEEKLSKMPEETGKAAKKAMEMIVQGKGEMIRTVSKEIDFHYGEYRTAQAEAAKLIVRNEEQFAKEYPNLPLAVLFEEWLENRNVDTGESLEHYQFIVEELEASGYGTLIRQVEKLRTNSSVSGEEIQRAFCKSWAGYQIRNIKKGLLKDSKFSYMMFRNKVEMLTEREESIRGNLKNEIRRIQMERMPRISEGVRNNTELGILQTLIRKNQVAIRSFFEQAPQMLLNICPCMMMDPSAVAEYIPSDFPKFDLVIIDEGSQMPTYNALIPISKADRCMIFGDEKQLQPMDTFKKRMEEDFEVSMERESILVAAYITSMPRKMLRFHYRSEDESLIAFSNSHYYNGNIITFPSCDTKISGVSYEFVENGFYDRDGSKGNEAEARQVIAKIRQIYGALPENTKQTLGIITLNINQRNLIQSMLYKEVRGDSTLGKIVDELVSVVNLESCQGKEWDYVLISPGFGNDKNNKFSQSFGALNQAHGWNRLNVMLTRARKKMIVITSIEPSMLVSAKSEGVQNFKEFLRYAKGEIALDKRARNHKERLKNKASGLVERVAAELEKEDYEVHTNIGSSDFKVDIGIVSKKDSNKYVLGILLDHFKESSSSIHDREVVYPRSLEYKGWKVYRLSELNWNSEYKHEMKQILKKIGEE